MQSRFDVKSIAGNIIPAVATTNAIAAGLQVLEGIRLLARTPVPDPDAPGAFSLPPVRDVCKFTWILRFPSARGKILQPSSLTKPNPRCFVCGTSQLTLRLDTTTTTLRTLIHGVLKGKLGFNTPNVDNNKNFLFCEEKDDDEDEDEFAERSAWMDLPLAV